MGLPINTNKDNTITTPISEKIVAMESFRPRLKKNKITKRFRKGRIQEAICCSSRKLASPKPAKKAPISIENPKKAETVAKTSAQEILAKNKTSVFLASMSNKLCKTYRFR